MRRARPKPRIELSSTTLGEDESRSLSVPDGVDRVRRACVPLRRFEIFVLQATTWWNATVGNFNPLPMRISEDALRRALEAGGHRFTIQRAAVYDVLVGTSSHPTADDVFTSVRAYVPDISLATVYKALEALVSCEVASKLPMGSGPARYDGRTDQHEHIRCLSCGCVHDIEGLRPNAWTRGIAEMTPFKVVGYRLELEGYCPDCVH